jgi:RHS repeat-associated protein
MQNFIESLVMLVDLYLKAKMALLVLLRLTESGKNTDHNFQMSSNYASLGYDSDLRAYRMGLRYCDPMLKRFLTPDPFFLDHLEECLKSPVQCNLYGYAAGNPVNFVDPSGLSGILTLMVDRGVEGSLMGMLGWPIEWMKQSTHNLMGLGGNTRNEPGRN